MKRHQVDSIDTSADHSWPTTIRLRNRGRRIRARRLLFESLEGRMLLSSTTIEDMRDQLLPYLAQGAVHGATIVTHGYQPQVLGSGDSLMDLALAIRDTADAGNAADEGAWLLDYDTSQSGTAVFDLDSGGSVLTGVPTEVVVLFDWASESNEESAGWGEAAGDALFSTIVQLGLVDPSQGQDSGIPLHFIGHSFGCAVTSEAVERLARFSVPVDQVTYLDPHDFDQAIEGIDTGQRLYELGLPQFDAPDGLDYGATV